MMYRFILNAIQWLLGLFWGIGTLVQLSQGNLLSGFFGTLLVVILIPPLRRWSFAQAKITVSAPVKVFLAFVLFIAMIGTVPSTSEIPPQPVEEQSPDLLGIQTEATPQASPTEEPTQTPTSTPISTITPSPLPTPIPTVPPTSTPRPTVQVQQISSPKPTNTPLPPTPTPTPASVTQESAPSGFSCNCSKTCTQMSSCDEAYYQLEVCGCSVRDGDNDGVPCENICPGG
jgi:outer membrane biosynthesis protein TonB